MRPTMLLICAFLMVVNSSGSQGTIPQPPSLRIVVQNHTASDVRVMFVANQKGANHFVDVKRMAAKPTERTTKIVPPRNVDQVIVVWDSNGKLMHTAVVRWDSLNKARQMLVVVRKDAVAPDFVFKKTN